MKEAIHPRLSVCRDLMFAENEDSIGMCRVCYDLDVLEADFLSHCILQVFCLSAKAVNTSSSQVAGENQSDN
jgi:hypothetical protein